MGTGISASESSAEQAGDWSPVPVVGYVMIGIFGGTFDPVHYGHLKPAQAVMQSLALSQIRFIPNRLPPHRAVPWLSSEKRQALLEIALRPYPGFVLDRRELQREEPSYMVDTLQSLKQDFPDKSLCLILGVDAFSSFEQWHQWQTILTLCHLVITQRPGFELVESAMSDFLRARIINDKTQLAVQQTGKILLQSVPQLAISSTEIRLRLQHGQAVDHWLPAGVYEQLKRFTLDD